MSGLQITVTPAGLAAIVNAQNTGTAPVLVSQIGVSNSGAGIVGGALDGEIKRLVTFAGDAVADDTIHLTLRDDTADVYTMRAFALYLADGTLFAWYAQAGVILEKSAQAMVLLAVDVRFVQIDATSLTFGNTDWINPPATTEVQGVIEVATNDESLAGDDPTRAVPPAGLKHVLDQRFGAGAPSGFVKGLLPLLTAAAIRVALELKSAALKDEGAGNGLDADKLDGQHGAYYLAWGNLTGTPASFPPSAHTHVWADITDPPSTATRWPAWNEVTAKPATFPPSAHTHAAADITSGTFVDARIAQSNVTQHQAALSITWTQVSGKPATFTPSAHTHVMADITDLAAALALKANLASPTFTGTPAAPTAAAATNTTQLATTAFVQAAIAAALANYLPKNNPTFTGTMTGPAYNKP